MSTDSENLIVRLFDWLEMDRSSSSGSATPFKVSPMRLFGEKDGSMRLEWAHQPKSVMVVEKIGDPVARKWLVDAVQYLFRLRHFSIFVELYVAESLTTFSFLQPFQNEHVTVIDFLLSFGGDGTLLHVSKLFPSTCPPIVPFAMGSLGFLTPFLCEEYETVIDDVVRGFFYVTSRTRLLCEIRRNNSKIELMQALNDIVFSSTSAGSVSAIECSIDGEYFTTVYGDGLIIATATGSTAYNLSAGGAIVHPSISTVIWSPICAHSLNAHPLFLPDSVELSLRIAPQDRQVAPYGVSCDSVTVPVNRGEDIVVRISPYTIPTVCRHEPVTDWLNSISTVLKWNQPMRMALPGESDSFTSTSNLALLAASMPE